MVREFPSEVLLEVFSHLPSSDWKSVCCLSKAWSVTVAKPVFDEIRYQRETVRPQHYNSKRLTKCRGVVGSKAAWVERAKFQARSLQSKEEVWGSKACVSWTIKQGNS
jgi:hypothetical protein